MIPKIIHYCWFGGNPYPDLVKRCIDSWKKHLPDFKIIEWNEQNFDVNSNTFVKEAYEAKKYAFVSDYVRLYALYNYGGIYLDSDVEVVKSLEPFLEHKAFTGAEDAKYCVTGTMGAEKHHPWIKKLLEYYDDKSFLGDGGSIPNTQIITNITKEMYGFESSSHYQNFNNELHIYPFEYFCAKDYKTGKIKKTENTYTIHHFNGSWLSEKQKKRTKRIFLLERMLNNLFGENAFDTIVKLKRKIYK